MECELNPRIPYTELSHIIKKQKEVPPAGRRCKALPALAPASCLLKAGERCGDVSALGNCPLNLPWEQACGADMGHCGGIYSGWGWLWPWAVGAADGLGLWGPTSWFGSPEHPAVPAHLPASNPPFPLQIIKKLIERKQAQIRKVYPGLTCFKEGVRQIPIESVPGIRESCQLLVGKGCLAGGLCPPSPVGVEQMW